MFKLINQKHESIINQFLENVDYSNLSKIVNDLVEIIEKIRIDIPEKKRISYGRFNIVKLLGEIIYSTLSDKKISIYDFVNPIFENPEHNSFVRSLMIQILTIHGENLNELEKVLTFIEKAAKDEDWIVRECSQGYVRKLTKKHPEQMHQWYSVKVNSDNALERRFVSESLRPVSENGWLKKQPEYALSIIQNLFKEADEYPRTSVGNSLSDWMRIDESNTLKIVKKLANNGDKNSYWIAYRACRNLVKKKPLLVMNILKTDEYIYKDRKFYRKDF